jgi:ubiquinone/menaquinone biosynthesis C-methylase UbiE
MEYPEVDFDYWMNNRNNITNLDIYNERKIGLDIACGDGSSTFEFKMQNPNYDIIGIDKNIQMVQEARQKYPQLYFISRNARDELFPENSIDKIRIKNGILDLESPKKVLEEVYTIIKQDGTIELIDYHEDHKFLIELYRLDPSLLRRYYKNFNPYRWKSLVSNFKKQFHQSEIYRQNDYIIQSFKNKRNR